MLCCPQLTGYALMSRTERIVMTPIHVISNVWKDFRINAIDGKNVDEGEAVC